MYFCSWVCVNDNTICGKKHYIYLRLPHLLAAQRLHWKAAAHKQHNHHRRCVSRSRALSKHSCQNITSDDERQGDSAPVTELSMLPHSLLDINKACALAQEVSLCQLHIHLSTQKLIHTWLCWGRFWIASVKCLWYLVKEFVLERTWLLLKRSWDFLIEVKRAISAFVSLEKE